MTDYKGNFKHEKIEKFVLGILRKLIRSAKKRNKSWNHENLSVMKSSTLSLLGLFLFEAPNDSNVSKYLNPMVLVFIGKLLQSAIR